MFLSSMRLSVCAQEDRVATRLRLQELWSLFSSALHHGVRLAGVLEAGRGPGPWPAVGARHRRLDVPLEEVEQRVPPGVGEVVIGRALQGLSRQIMNQIHI